MTKDQWGVWELVLPDGTLLQYTLAQHYYAVHNDTVQHETAQNTHTKLDPVDRPSIEPELRRHTQYRTLGEACTYIYVCVCVCVCVCTRRS